MYGQNSTLPELACPEIVPCNEHPVECRQIFDIYSDLSNSAPVNIRDCYYNKFGGGTLGTCNYVGEYQTLTMLLSGRNETGNPSCLTSEGTTSGVRVPRLSLMSFPFGMNTPRTEAAELATGTNQRVLTIKEQLTHFNLLPNNQNLYMLSSIGFTGPPIFPESDQDEWTVSDNEVEPRVVVPHSVIKHNIYTYCDTEPIDSIAVIIDNTRGKARYYPFEACNDYDDSSCQTSNTEHDIAIVPFIQLNNSATMPSGFNYLNYFPLEEIPVCPAFSCMAWDGTSTDLDLCEYIHPTPYSLVGVHLQGTESASYALGYTVNDDGSNLQAQDGIKHTYIVDKNFDITQINPEERIFYNPSEVHIEADNLIFPSGYSFVTARGTPPTLTDIDNTPCDMKATIDQRYMPVVTDQPNTTYTKTDETTVTVKPSVYILEPGSKLTIEPCVHLYDLTFVVKPGARLIYYPNQLFGNFDPAQDIIFDGTTSAGTVTAINYTGGCHDCRCEQNYAFENNADITADETWQDRIMHIKGVIRVKSGVKLEIKNCRLYFADSDFTSQQSGIYIEPGAKVVIDRSLLTAVICQKNWDGIVVEGNPDLPQWPETNQGVLQIANSTLEKARTGITAMKWFNWGGGIVRASNTVFKNNNMSFLSGLYQHASASYFNNCVFELTKAHSGCFLAQVVLINNQNIHFRDCTFRNSFGYGNDCFEAANDERIAILAYQSDFYVGPPYDLFPTPPNPNAVSAQSIISGFNKGIDTYGAMEWGARATIWRTRFENNFYGYVANGSNLDQITESTFQDNIYNTFFHHATNYTIAGNTFLNTNPDIAIDNDFGYGAINHQSAGGSRIFTNTFNGLYQGVTIEGSNSGLQIKCNNFLNFGISSFNARCPWVINTAFLGGGLFENPVLDSQGENCNPGHTAGNLFKNNSQEDIFAAAPVAFTYHANGTPIETVPDKAGEVALINIENCQNLIEDDSTCPELPDLNGFPDGTRIGDGSPTALANHIRNTALTDVELAALTANATQRYLQNDSTQQEALAFLAAVNTPRAWRMLLGAKLHQTDTTQARQYWQLLLSDPNTDTGLLDYYKLFLNIAANGRNMANLLPQEIENLQTMAGTASNTAVYAQCLLAMPHLQTYNRLAQPITESGKRPNNASLASWIYPNPADQTINIASSLQWETATLYNLHGREVATYVYSTSSLPIPDKLPSGIYIIFLQLANGGRQTARLFISK